MPHFTDTANRSWTVTIDVAALRRVRRTLNLNLADGVDLTLAVTAEQTGDVPLLSRMASEPDLLADVLFVLVQPQAAERSITDEQFATGLDGPVLVAGLQAIIEGLSSFFRTPAAKIVQTLLTRQVARANKELTPEAIDGICQEAENHAAAKLFGRFATSSPDSSASIPDRLPAAS